MSDLSVLPVAPEFTEILTENAVATLIDYLRETNAPPAILDLTRHIENLGYYLAECYRAPEILMRDRKDRIDIEEIVVETINAIALSGGTFKGPTGESQPRQVPQPVKVRK